MSTLKKIMIALVIATFLVISVSADYPWRNPIYHTQPPTELPTSPAPPLVQTTAIPGPDVSEYHYNVMVLDGINPAIVRQALQYIPCFFSFEMVEEDASQYSFQNGYAVPQFPRLITVYNGTMHGYTLPNAMGYYYGNGMSTIVYLGQDPYILSWPILHECLHEALPKSGSTIDQDQQPTFIDQWNAWMGERGLGFWSGSDPQISAGWVRLKQDFLVSQCLTL